MQTLEQVRVLDPILTSHAHGYSHAERVGNLLFPPVTVFVSGGQVLEFGKESFLKYNARRAPGTATKRIDFGYLGKPFALLQDALESPLPREHVRDANVMPGIDLGRIRVNGLMDILSLLLEAQQAEIAQNPANYDNSHKDALGVGEHFNDPEQNVPLYIDQCKDVVRATVGAYPNVLLAGPQAFTAMKNAPSVIERFKYTNKDALTREMLGQLFDIPVVAVGKAVTANDAGVFSDVWGNNIVLAYVPPGSLGRSATYAPGGAIDYETPSYGYTYTMSGHPVVEEPYYEKNAKSWIYGCTYERVPVLTGLGAGFLIEDVFGPTE